MSTQNNNQDTWPKLTLTLHQTRHVIIFGLRTNTKPGAGRNLVTYSFYLY